MTGSALLLLWMQAGLSAPETLANDLRGGYQVLAVDLNRDGRVDLVALASGLDHLDWFENPGGRGGTWKRHVIAGGLKQMINVAAKDLDGDGIPELLVAHEFANIPALSKGLVTLFEHEGDPRGAWKRREVEARSTSHRLKVANGEFVNAPLANAKAEPPEYRAAVPLVVYRGKELKPEVISTAERGVMHGLSVVDFNGDGREDILTASFAGLAVYLGQKDGSYRRRFLHKGSEAAWPRSGSSEIVVVRRGQKDFWIASIDPWHGNELAVYEKGERRVIDGKFVEGHTVLAVDLDGDGVDEIVYGSRKEGGMVKAARYDSVGKAWKVETVLEGKMATNACVAMDGDGDKRPDIACIGGATQNLMVWWNEAK